MTGAEVRAARERMGLSRGELAAEIGLFEDVIRSWEDGSVTPPRGTEQNLAYTEAVRERTAALAASGLPECAWVTEWEQEPDEEDLDRITEQLERLNEHSAACPTCNARERYLEQSFPPLPELYTPPSFRVLDAGLSAFERIPSWLQPAAAGALIMLFLVGFRVLSPDHGGWADRFIALLGAMGAGACGGLVYSAVHPAFRTLGRPGMVLTGTACTLTSVSLIALLRGPLGFGHGLVDEGQVNWMIVLVLSLGIGLVWGYNSRLASGGTAGGRRS